MENPVTRRVLKKLAMRGSLNVRDFEHELFKTRIRSHEAKYFLKELKIRNGKIEVK